MSAITTHVLDTSTGRPAAGLAVRLEQFGSAGDWTPLASGATDADGRLASLLREGQRPDAGTYRLVFESGEWFAGRDVTSFYPWVAIVFQVRDGSEHHHVPLLLSPWGYSTYRGS